MSGDPVSSDLSLSVRCVIFVRSEFEIVLRCMRDCRMYGLLQLSGKVELDLGEWCTLRSPEFEFAVRCMDFGILVVRELDL